MFEQIKEKLKSMLAEMSTVKTVDGTTYQIDGDELEVGVEVKDAEGNAATDGEYTFEDGTKVTVKDGVITEVVETETEEEEEETTSTTTEEPKTAEEEEDETTTTEAPVETEEEVEEEPDLQAQIDELKKEIEAIRAKLDELANTPAAETIIEEFEKANEVTDKFNSKLNNALRYAKTLKK